MPHTTPKTLTKINSQPLFPFGVDIKGSNITQITPDEVNELKQHLADQGVAVIRSQHITDAAFVTFLKQLGTLTFTVGETPVATQPLLNIVSIL